MNPCPRAGGGKPASRSLNPLMEHRSCFHSPVVPGQSKSFGWGLAILAGEDGVVDPQPAPMIALAPCRSSDKPGTCSGCPGHHRGRKTSGVALSRSCRRFFLHDPNLEGEYTCPCHLCFSDWINRLSERLGKPARPVRRAGCGNGSRGAVEAPAPERAGHRRGSAYAPRHISTLLQARGGSERFSRPLRSQCMMRRVKHASMAGYPHGEGKPMALKLYAAVETRRICRWPTISSAATR
jgi:hypothetical protein